MEGDICAAEEKWRREGNGSRGVSGARRCWSLPLTDGATIVVYPGDLPEEEKGEYFEDLLMQHWCERYGDPEARARMLAFIHGDGDVA